jgi:D-alanyl-D-alanine carboxypeptidase/D-alanyl-D-alanine-endopeptidase (penicillin-binding protein 4)
MFLKFAFRWLCMFSLILLLLPACRSSKGSVQRVSGKKSLEQSFEHSATFKGLTGFLLMDQTTTKVIYEKNADTYFTPASNTKVLTLFTAMKILRGDVPNLRYLKTEEGEMYIQGTGHPALLNPAFPTDSNTALSFLQKQKQVITFCDCNFQDKKYGSGWSWDDFHYYFQSEKSSLPIYGNNVSFLKTSKKESIRTIPSYFEKNITIETDTTIKRTAVSRNWDNNYFTIFKPSNNYPTSEIRPFRTNKETIAQLLSDTLHQEIKTCNNTCTNQDYLNINSAVPANDLYKELMQPSDNFVAEQLLLICSNQLFDTLNVSRTIKWAQDSLFQFLPEQPRWVDGSGLSRYNMITPRNMVTTLNELYKEYPEQELFDLFPTGGESGTIKSWYGGLGKPYVFAKTGTLRHIHCLSGYLVTKSGRRLVFSFMHNNYMGDMRALKREMEKILQLVYVAF